jgi:hypothetical protein
VVQTPFQAPNANAYAERFGRSIKHECLNRVIPLGDRHLRWTIAQFVAHYDEERNHQGLGNELIDGARLPFMAAAAVVSARRASQLPCDARMMPRDGGFDGSAHSWDITSQHGRHPGEYLPVIRDFARVARGGTSPDGPPSTIWRRNGIWQ